MCLRPHLWAKSLLWPISLDWPHEPHRRAARRAEIQESVPNRIAPGIKRSLIHPGVRHRRLHPRILAEPHVPTLPWQWLEEEVAMEGLDPVPEKPPAQETLVVYRSEVQALTVSMRTLRP